MYVELTTADSFHFSFPTIFLFLSIFLFCQIYRVFRVYKWPATLLRREETIFNMPFFSARQDYDDDHWYDLKPVSYFIMATFRHLIGIEGSFFGNINWFEGIYSRKRTPMSFLLAYTHAADSSSFAFSLITVNPSLILYWGWLWWCRGGGGRGGRCFFCLSEFVVA